MSKLIRSLPLYQRLALILATLLLAVSSAVAATTLKPSEVLSKLSGREFTTSVTFMQNLTASAPVASFIATKAYRLRGLAISCADNRGSAGNTTVIVLKNGSAISGVTVSSAYTETDGAVKYVGTDTAIAAGDVLTASVSAVTTTLKCIGLGGRMDLVESF